MPKLRRTAIDLVRTLQAIPSNRVARRLCADYHIAGKWKRIYFYHIRKAGGTSLKMAFLRLGGESHEDVNTRLFASPIRRAISGNYVFQGHVKKMIEQGHFFYGFSHRAAHEFALRPDTYTFTIFRDPTKRLLSHYRMLVGMADGSGPPMPRGEEDLAADGFHAFLDRLDRSHILRQLYMFSRNFDVNEAVDRVAQLNRVFYTEMMEDGIRTLSDDLQLELDVRHERKSPTDIEIPEDGPARARELLQPEYDFLHAWTAAAGPDHPAPDYARS